MPDDKLKEGGAGACLTVRSEHGLIRLEANADGTQLVLVDAQGNDESSDAARGRARRFAISADELVLAVRNHGTPLKDE
ncbi:MAG TPA: hypothetical protein VIL30_19960 [Ramlibacter sp.]|jgi:hypothetical protein